MKDVQGGERRGVERGLIQHGAALRLKQQVAAAGDGDNVDDDENDQNNEEKRAAILKRKTEAKPDVLQLIP